MHVAQTNGRTPIRFAHWVARNSLMTDATRNSSPREILMYQQADHFPRSWIVFTAVFLHWLSNNFDGHVLIYLLHTKATATILKSKAYLWHHLLFYLPGTTTQASGIMTN
ncbi:hypothetical protein AN958_08282 [Leucoagaricus sp. SymC.cos]|nr:hypothetical protein AN958_08282 [Leucoagaricus sp. SymC.cos]